LDNTPLIVTFTNTQRSAPLRAQVMRPTIVFVALLIALSCSTPEPADVETRIRQVEENITGVVLYEGQEKWTIKDRMDFHKVPGLSIAVIRDHKIDWAKGYGWADVSEKREVTPATLFQAASSVNH
jgi:CubicO group peptidase (beta-lactamase class C family)